MSISQYIKEIGRGKEGARSLSAEQAEDLMTQVLEGRITDLELGAFAIAMRIKGETPTELAAFLTATRRFCVAPASQQPVVWLPSYNGARKLPNLTPLLALLLARQGVPVLVHGPLVDPGRVTTAEVFQALGLGIARDAGEIGHAWARGEPAFVSTGVLCPPLARLLEVRRVVGLRNSGHTVAKVLLPPARSEDAGVFRVVNHTHPEYAGLLSAFLAETGADAMLLRGTEGEPVADPRRTPRMEVFIGGERSEAFSVAAREGVLTKLPELPPVCDAGSTAGYITTVLAGTLPLPEPISLQADRIVSAVRAVRAGLGKTLPRDTESQDTESAPSRHPHESPV